MQRTLEPVTLMLTGQSIVAEANPSVPLYDLGRGVTALSPKPSSAKFERIEYEDDDLLKEGSIASLDQRSHHLFYLALTRCPVPHWCACILHHNSVTRDAWKHINLTSVCSLKSLLPKAEFKAVLNPGKSTADSDLFGPANQQILFHTKPKWKGGQYQWIDAQGQKVAYESSKNNEHKLVILEPLDRTTRDALAALWALGLWVLLRAGLPSEKRDGDTAAVGDEKLATEYAGSQDRGSMSQKRTRISTANLLGRFGGANNIREVGFIIYQSVSQVAPAQQQRYCPILLEPWYLYFDIYPPHL
ncbi:hypothetical protein BGZ61DRAFT_484384 [Ilyonectria robusta]|uniref:uncharacterized protein n=1 Tax=Ilyonectria robusta TaxID=1079257 RepID=UPI001E8CED46|nr:uncharacterized protein BGZ61DRAFT_484384 [Ilyonectria robusta]KAH8665677.1 hypothetical protein BGZ61DRAFT_484384 [Ilyonectria robusta]